MQLSVIIISYNVKYHLEQCLHSVLAACKNIEAEIVVIDNASADNSIDYLKPKFPLVNFVRNETNAGFAKANNKALNIVKGEFVLYLNPDTIIAGDAITNCISFLNEHKEAGGVGVKMIDGNGNFLPESKRAFPSVMASFFKLSGMAALFPHSSVFNKYALGNLSEDEIHETDVLAGAFFISPRHLQLSLHGFDEDFFMYGEDIDLSYRIQKAGYKNYYLGNNVIIHFKGESTQKNAVYVKNFYGAMKIFVEKHYKNTSSLFLKMTISTGAFLSLPVKKIKRLFASVKKQNTHELFILVGDESAVGSAQAILTQKGYPVQILTTNKLLTIIRELMQLQPASNLVFCIHTLSYADCVQFVQNNKNRFSYYWHCEDSLSIISGSNSSGAPQIYIAV
jgi:GT2 family glycosyltransferase